MFGAAHGGRSAGQQMSKRVSERARMRACSRETRVMTHSFDRFLHVLVVGSLALFRLLWALLLIHFVLLCESACARACVRACVRGVAVPRAQALWAPSYTKKRVLT